jgi:orotidine-5'-phosphate decarboxylase
LAKTLLSSKILLDFYFYTLNFSDRLFQKQKEKESLLCVGLDPHFDLVPEEFKRGKSSTLAIENFLLALLPVIAPHCSCVKPNLAFYEIWGSEGWKVLENICEQAKKMGLIVIADGKRNDIGSTACKYASAFLGMGTPFDALTVTPYVGQDGILPFVETASKNEKGVFILVKTSNPGAGEFQDLAVGDSLLHEEVAQSVSRIGSEYIGESGFSCVGAVIGATHPEDIKILRTEMPSQPFLVPGYGTQGGSKEDILPAFYQDGRGAVINASRSILFASAEKGSDVVQNVGNAAKVKKEELNEIVYNRF